MQKIMSTSSLRVKQLSSDRYLVWTWNVYGLLTPKLMYQVTEDEKVTLKRITGQFKSVTINTIITIGIVSLPNLLFENGDWIKMMPLYAGIVVFFLIGNFLVIESTKSKVKRQTSRK